MTLASSGTMSIGGTTTDRSINLELGRSATATSSLGETDLRTLAGVASGAISMDDFYGASASQSSTDITAGYTFYTYTGGRGSTQYGFDTGYRSQNTSAPTGSISYTDDLIVGSTNIGSLYRADCEQNGQLRHRMQVELTNATNSNSGFTNIVFSRIGGDSTTIARTAMTYSYSSGRRIYISATELDSDLIYTAGGSGTGRYCKYWGPTSGYSAGTGTDSSATGRVEFT